jgi:hypothetical protein
MTDPEQTVTKSFAARLKLVGVGLLGLWTLLAGITLVYRLYLKVALGHGAEQYYTGYGYKISYVAALVAIASTPLALVGAWLIGYWERRHERDFKQRYGHQPDTTSRPPAAPKYPPEWREKVPAVVFGCLVPGEIRLTVAPEAGLADGGTPYDLRADLVPAELRMPNTPLWVECDDKMQIVRVWRRTDE